VAKPGVRVTITGDAQGLEKALNRSSGALAGFGKTALGVFGGGLLLKGFDAAVGGLQELGRFATDGIGKLDAYGDAVARLDAMAAGLGATATGVDLTKFGVDQGEAAASALAFAKMGQAIGLTDDELRATTPQLQRMAAQLASLGDGDPAAQAELLAKAIGGNAKAAKALGVALPKGATGMAAWAAIAAQLGPQLDEATGGTASLADVGERWGAVMANLQLKLAGFLESLAPVVSALLDQLLPAFDRLVAVVGPMLEAAFAKLAETFSAFAEGGGASYVAELLSAIATIAGQLGAFLVDRVLPVIGKLAAAMGKALGPALAAAADAFESWMPVLSQVWGFLEATVVPILANYVIPLVGKLLELFLRVAGIVGGALSTSLSTLARWFDRLVNVARPLLDLLEGIGRFGGDVIGSIAGAVGLNDAGGQAAGRSIVVNVSAGVGDPVAIGKLVSRTLGAYTSRGGVA
jgi:phage-related protein